MQERYSRRAFWNDACLKFAVFSPTGLQPTYSDAMPIYEYRCKACGAETEIMQRISDPAVRKCPACGKLRLVKSISAAGFRLSGGGWYESDFKSGGKKNMAGDQSEPAVKLAGKEKPADAAKPAKPDKKTESKAKTTK